MMTPWQQTKRQFKNIRYDWNWNFIFMIFTESWKINIFLLTQLLTKQFFNHKLLSYLKGSKNKVEKKPNFQRNHSSIKQTKVMSLPNNSKGAFFSEIAIRFSNLQKKYSKRLSWAKDSYSCPCLSLPITVLCYGWEFSNFKFRIVFWNIFLEIL